MNNPRGYIYFPELYAPPARFTAVAKVQEPPISASWHEFMDHVVSGVAAACYIPEDVVIVSREELMRKSRLLLAHKPTHTPRCQRVVSP